MSSLAEVRPLLPPARLDAVINAIGETRFEAELLGFLDHSFGADHLAIFGLDGERPTVSGSGPTHCGAMRGCAGRGTWTCPICQ